MNIDFNYNLEDKCLAGVKFKADTFEIKFDASCLYDSMYAFIDSAKKLLLDKRVVIVPFFGRTSSAIYQFVIRKISDKEVEIELRLYKDIATYNRIASREYEMLFKGRTTLKHYVKNAYKIATDIKSKYTLDEYQKMWGHQFPEEFLNKLTVLIKESDLGID
ncbi:hypothetical protein [Chondrinema litorale]|uniref:hypothetical protein n=1 Tax=Chondrinema litorale TaxID=2994555 RepID=UPI0025437EDA|nr:hypothetical protein [Chondrinema litorale]UZR96120.1 hypothetical protein OQ292_09905 [Chondrinema litorale]